MQETTTLESEIASLVQGSVTGGPSHAVRCDYGDQPLSIEDRQTDECVPIVPHESVDEHTLPEGWFDDTLRCRDCERSALDLPTRGYAEALVDVDLVTVDGVTVLDGDHLERVDTSSGDDGETVNGLPLPIRRNVIMTRDWVRLRWIRLRKLADGFRGSVDDTLRSSRGRRWNPEARSQWRLTACERKTLRNNRA